ncbi:MAG: cell division/cell wall cluster transcriptional repressor MraZ [Gemmatimonadetes bacterium]|nr:cell division/cell wall cluster transcriptional repressor MraZ [Gemmatimonadota bacterium]
MAEQQTFVGDHPRQIDAKGRVSLPVEFRRGRGHDGFFLARIGERCLALFSPEDWLEVQARLLESAREEPARRNRVVAVTRHAVQRLFDAQGRFLIPPGLREAVGLKRDVIVAGRVQRIELWDPEALAAAEAAAYADEPPEMSNREAFLAGVFC